MTTALFFPYAVFLGLFLGAEPAPPETTPQETGNPPLPSPPAETPPAERDSPFLGLVTRPKVESDEMSGLVVSFVYPRSSAEEIGFAPGDEIRSVNDMLIRDRTTFVEELRRSRVGARLRFVILRKDEELRVSGRIRGYLQTLRAYQETLRKEMVGKPLPDLPGADLWKPESKTWEPTAPGWASLRGKISVVVSFDDCPTCRQSKLEKVSQMKALLSSMKGADQLAFLGIYYDEQPGKRGRTASRAAAAKLLAEVPPTFPVVVAHYPGDHPPDDAWGKQVLIHNHGIAILDSDTNIFFLQILGAPGPEFLAAYGKAIRPLTEAKEPVEVPTQPMPPGPVAKEPPKDVPAPTR